LEIIRNPEEWSIEEAFAEFASKRGLLLMIYVAAETVLEGDEEIRPGKYSASIKGLTMEEINYILASRSIQKKAELIARELDEVLNADRH
jgi:hypothetical protein